MTTRTVLVNGREQHVDGGTTLASLIESHGLRGEWVVVEHNGEPLDRATFPRIELNEGDRVEIVRAVAGGSA